MSDLCSAVMGAGTEKLVTAYPMRLNRSAFDCRSSKGTLSHSTVEYHLN